MIHLLVVWLLCCCCWLFSLASAESASPLSPPTTSSQRAGWWTHRWIPKWGQQCHPPQASLSHKTQGRPSRFPSSLVLLLDVDNTLYCEEQVGIERQIVQHLHEYAREVWNLTAAQVDEWHARYGSTLQGLLEVYGDTNVNASSSSSSQQMESLSSMADRPVAPAWLGDFFERVYGRVQVAGPLLGSGSSTNRIIPLVVTTNESDMSDTIHQDVRGPTRALRTAVKTGYSHDGALMESGTVSHRRRQQQQRRLADVLEACRYLSAPGSRRSAELHVASNSPRSHIAKVLQAAGLAHLPWQQWWTPDREVVEDNDDVDDGINKDLSHENEMSKQITRRRIVAATKHDPMRFFGSLLPPTDNRSTPPLITWSENHIHPILVLLDDSVANLRACAPYMDLSRCIAHNDTHSLIRTLSTLSLTNNTDYDAGHLDLDQLLLPGGCLGVQDGNSEYIFDQIEYLRAKNLVDLRSLHRPTWHRLAQELRRLLFCSEGGEVINNVANLTVVDLGAGLLPMLKWMIFGGQGGKGPALIGNATDEQLPSLVSLIMDVGESDGPIRKPVGCIQECHYYAYEPNQNLQYDCLKELKRLGFSLQQTYHWDSPEGSLGSTHFPEMILVATLPAPGHGLDPKSTMKVVVHLRWWDFTLQMIPAPSPLSPHLVVGSCFADLHEPYQLASSLLLHFFSKLSPGKALQPWGLVYFPITFRGVTQFVPPSPFEPGPRTIPSDTTAFALYAKSLKEQNGHHLDTWTLEKALRSYGAICVSRGRSDWIISPQEHSYLWRTMMHFFTSVAVPELHCAGWDAPGWLRRSLANRPVIQAANYDFVFRMPFLGHWSPLQRVQAKKVRSSVSEIQFQAPFTVTTTERDLKVLGPGQIRLESVCSLISSGTELKVYRGQFDDAALDVNIKGLAEERMGYPLAYGYCLVGRIVECGSDVEDADDLLGELAFSFSPHASQVVVDRSAVHIVPHGIDALDAVFMPSVETALSIVHDAHPRLGEHVAVFGQGLIGLLITSLLKMSILDYGGEFGTLTVFDSIPDRLVEAAAMGATEALLPNIHRASGLYDVSIEVSGSGLALQSAIDMTRNGGRVVVGSWYGNAPFNLTLGIDFHRSHKTLTASQVSTLPADMTMTWSKERRFALTWDLVKRLRPSRLITSVMPFQRAEEAYQRLHEGREITVAFEFT